jgi:uncharacterized protein
VKKIYDSVHGFIYLNPLENELIDTYPFQRLRYIKQLGITYMVYPGATHSRFEHSLGTMELATRMYDQMMTKTTLKEASHDYEYWRQIVRLGALCHDLGHLPFSHVAEKVLLGDAGHEYWTLQVIECKELNIIWDKLRKQYHDRDVMIDVIKIALGEEKTLEFFPNKEKCRFNSWESALSQMICGDFFGADRIDYLLRDAKCTGVTYGFFDYQQLIETLRILPSKKEGKQGLELGVEENGIEACEALLLSRHFMYKRVYQVSSVKSYAFHMARFLKKFLLFNNLEEYLRMTDNEVISALHRSKDLDAICFLDRQRRFKARPLPRGVKESDLEAIAKKLKIPEGMVEWSLNHEKNEVSSLAFPVLNRRHDVGEAKEYSQISIPSRISSWLYISPEYEERFLLSL